MNLKDNLKKIRKDNNLSQEQLAEKLGVSRQSVSKWESGQAYPEMDKVLQICNMFNLNIDELLNQNIKEVNSTKQSKLNINKYIDDFLEYITKTIDMFTSMKFKNKIKCIIEQIFILGILSLVFFILGEILHVIFWNMFNFIPGEIFYTIESILGGIYCFISLVTIIPLILYIFKVRYLDYYVVVKKDESKEEIKEETIEEKKENKIYLEKKQEKIIIRDPKHSGYKFISGILKCILFFLKTIVALLACCFSISFVAFIMLLILSFVFIKTGILFIGSLLLLLSLIILNLLVLIISYNIIFSKKQHWNKYSILFIISLILIGISSAFISIGVTKFDYTEDLSESAYTETTKTIKMNKDLIIDAYAINYIESNNKDVKVVIKHSPLNNIDLYNYNNSYYINFDFGSENIFYNIRHIIKDINNLKIVDYYNYSIDIYTTKENINILKSNLEKQNEYEKEISNYQERINELYDNLNQKENKINDLEYQIQELKEKLSFYGE